MSSRIQNEYKKWKSYAYFQCSAYRISQMARHIRDIQHRPIQETPERIVHVQMLIRA